MPYNTLSTLQFTSTDDYQTNLKTLTDLIRQTATNTIVLAPEVCLTGFDYKHFDEAAAFYDTALEALLPLSQERIICLTLIQKDTQGKFYNVATVLHKGSIIHQQGKHQLFRLGDEHQYFTPSIARPAAIFEVEGIKIGILICFELRFKQYWQALEGADIILIPARWGKLRSDHFVTLSRALAVMNQCYVLASDSSNEECSGMSGIISPFGEAEYNRNNSCLSVPYNTEEIRRMRRYLNVGIK